MNLIHLFCHWYAIGAPKPHVILHIHCFRFHGHKVCEIQI